MEKIVGIRKYKGYNLAIADIDITDKLHMKYYLSSADIGDSNVAAFDFALCKFNTMSAEEKIVSVFPKINEINEDDKERYIKESVENFFKKHLAQKEMPKRYIGSTTFRLDRFYDTSKFQVESIKVLNQLNCFNEMDIPEKTKEFINEYVEKIKEVEIGPKEAKEIYAQYTHPIKEYSEYVIYVGDKEELIGYVGKIESFRDDVASTLVRFNHFKENGSNRGYWCKEESLLKIYI